MRKEKAIVVGGEETFVARVLTNKVKATGAECDFVLWTVNDIYSHMDGVSLIILYMNDGVRPKEDVLHFLADTMKEKKLHTILVGEQADIQYVMEHVPGELVYTTFSRPVDNTKFTETVTEYFTRAKSGSLKKSILIVDDDPQYLTLVREWLRETYKVAMANSGPQAINWLEKNKADLILLDYEMPVTSGPQVLEMLRNNPETASVPVMFLTGKDDKESVMAVLSLKPEGYFLKSIQKDELFTRLQEFFILHK